MRYILLADGAPYESTHTSFVGTFDNDKQADLWSSTLNDMNNVYRDKHDDGYFYPQALVSGPISWYHYDITSPYRYIKSIAEGYFVESTKEGIKRLTDNWNDPEQHPEMMRWFGTLEDAIYEATDLDREIMRQKAAQEMIEKWKAAGIPDNAK